VATQGRKQNLVKILLVKYNKGNNSGYFIKTRAGKYIPVFIETGVFSELKDVVEEKEISVGLFGNIE